MHARLVSYRNGRIDLAFPLENKRATFGRDADNSIQLPHEKVSKHHGAIFQSGDCWTIEDLHSTNGILVNGQPVQRATLKDGDTVQIGGYELRFETNVPSPDWVPSYVLNFSAQTTEQTAFTPRPPKQT